MVKGKRRDILNLFRHVVKSVLPTTLMSALVRMPALSAQLHQEQNHLRCSIKKKNYKNKTIWAEISSRVIANII